MTESSQSTSNSASFWRTISYGLAVKKNRRAIGSRSPTQVFSKLELHNISPGEGGSEPQPGHPNFATAEMMTHRRIYFVSKEGRLGLRPPGILSGDKVYILPYGRVPFILRLLQLSEVNEPCKRTKEPCFILVGDCYLDRIMSGEAVKKVNDRDPKEIHLHQYPGVILLIIQPPLNGANF